MLFKVSVSLLVFHLDDLSIEVSGVLKSLIIIILLSISPFMSVNICFMYLGVFMIGTYISIVFSSWIDRLIIM